MHSEGTSASGSRLAQTALVPPPLNLEGTAYEAAANVPLPPVAPGSYPGLHNVYRLSDTIISGSEPHDEEALAQLAAWGVRTVISVDGKAPDLEGAAKSDLTYVHIPLRYSGMSDEQISQMAKSFRELEAPFYVHCFHGKHRGPAAAAVGRVALDGLDREVAIAEMRQWSTTASKYEGLYSSVATSRIPSAEETAVFDFDFTPSHSFDGIRDGMIRMTRVFDDIKLVRKAGWKTDPAHPDLDPLQTATQLAQYFRACGEIESTETRNEDYVEMMAEGVAASEEILRLLTDCRAADAGADPASIADQLELAFDAAAESCADCHSIYRNR